MVPKYLNLETASALPQRCSSASIRPEAAALLGIPGPAGCGASCGTTIKRQSDWADPDLSVNAESRSDERKVALASGKEFTNRQGNESVDSLRMSVPITL
jgi:hypothetical protein